MSQPAVRLLQSSIEHPSGAVKVTDSCQGCVSSGGGYPSRTITLLAFDSAQVHIGMGQEPVGGSSDDRAFAQGRTANPGCWHQLLHMSASPVGAR